MSRIIFAVVVSAVALYVVDGGPRPIDWLYAPIAYYCMLTLIDIERNQKGNKK